MRCFRRVTAIVLGFMLLAGIPGIEALAEVSVPRSVPYVDANGAAMTPEHCLPVAMKMTYGWYAVTEDTEYNEWVEISGAVNLILCDGKTLKANKGVHVPEGASLTIWGQSVYTEGSNTGKLVSVGKSDLAGIGPEKGKKGGTIVINGGNIDSRNSNKSIYSPGIGGSVIVINGGKVHAKASYCAAIGGSDRGECGDITINGGEVQAEGSNGAAIGSGDHGTSSGSVTINGGTVTASGESGAGIGGGWHSCVNSIRITGGTVTATSLYESAGIGGGANVDCGTNITISGGSVTATSKGKGAGIGSAKDSACKGDITITGHAVVTATCEGDGAGIGSGVSGNTSGKITISGGARVTATGKGKGAGIGGSWSGVRHGNLNGIVIINGNAVVTARGSDGGAGIGGGKSGNAKDGHIHISGNARVYAYGGTGAAGIGGGMEETAVVVFAPVFCLGGEGCGDVRIEGSATVFAQSGEGNCSAIGHGDNDEYMGAITFGRGMSVKAGNTLDGIDGTYEPLFSAGQREAACQWRHKALIQPCDHAEDDIHYVYIKEDSHLRDTCAYCDHLFTEESHMFDDETHQCTLCGYEFGGELVTISFDANGGSGDVESFTYMPEGIYAPPECGFTAPAGKVFQGWQARATGTTAEDPVSGIHYPGEPFLLPGGGDVKLIAQWEGDTKVTISPGEGTGENKVISLAGGENYPLPTPESLGFTGPEWYSFAGWRINDDAANLKQPLEPVTVENNMVITAAWTRAARTVTFDPNGGSAVAAQTVQNGETAAKPADPTRNSDTFLGWYLGDEAFDFTTPVTGDMALTARWAQDLTAYTVTFADGLGNVLATQTVIEGKSATAPGDPAREGYTFTGWDTDFSDVQSDLTVTARWKQNIVTHTVTFEDGQGNVLDTQTVVEGRPASAPADPVMDGFLFSGWDTDFSSVTKDLTVKALWMEASKEEGKYTVVFVFGFGLDSVSQAVSQNGEATAPPVPAVSGYTFTGWDKAFTNVTENLTVTAGWKKNTAGEAHTVVFVDGYSVSPLLIQRVKAGGSATPPADPEREGYTFDGWDTDFSYVTDDLTVIAQWKQNVTPPKPANEPATVTKAPTGRTLTYTGSAQELITAGTAEGGTMKYAPGTAAEATGPYTATVPKGTDAKTYYIWYKVVGDRNHDDSAAEKVEATIAPKSIAGAVVTLDRAQLTYIGSEQSVKVTGVAIDGLILAESDYTVSGKTAGTEKATYTVTVNGKGNYKDTAAAEWSIVEKAMTVSAENVRVKYDGQPHGISVTVTDPADGWSVKYGTAKGTYDLDKCPTLTDVGTLPVYFKVTADNYDDYTAVATVTVTKAASSVKAAPKAVEGLTEDGEAHGLVTAGTAEGGEMQYTLGTEAEAAGSYAAAIPTGKDAGTYYVWYKAVGDANHSDSEAAFIAVTIEEKPAEDKPAEDQLEEDIPDEAKEEAITFVARLYRLILGREAENLGYDAWVNALASGKAGAAQVINGFFRSEEYLAQEHPNENTIQRLYRVMLDREADTEGLKNWAAILDGGASVMQVVEGIGQTDEKFFALCKENGVDPGLIREGTVAPGGNIPKTRAFVSRCYPALLGRTADEGGLEGWTQALLTGNATARQIILGFVNSAEYKAKNLSNGQVIETLYAAMMGRAADAEGKKNWTAILDGTTVETVINEFAGSDEFKAVCKECGIATGHVGGEQDAPAQPVSEYTDEAKVRAFVEHCYVVVFGREGDAEGIGNYTKLILDGKMTPAQAIRAFISSAEFMTKLPGNEDYVKILYRAYLNREADAEGLAAWLAQLNGGTVSPEQLLGEFENSSEFKDADKALKN